MYGTGRATLQIGPQTESGAITKVIKDDYRKDGMLFLQSADWTSQVEV